MPRKSRAHGILKVSYGCVALSTPPPTPRDAVRNTGGPCRPADTWSQNRAARPAPPNPFALGDSPTSTPAPCQRKPTVVGQHNGCDPYSIGWHYQMIITPRTVGGTMGSVPVAVKGRSVFRARAQSHGRCKPFACHHKHFKGPPPDPNTILWSPNRHRFLPGTPHGQRQHT